MKKTNMYTTRGIYIYIYIYIIYKFSKLYCMPYDNVMDKVEVNDAHDNDDH
jgi:hypothetical protein